MPQTDYIKQISKIVGHETFLNLSPKSSVGLITKTFASKNNKTFIRNFNNRVKRLMDIYKSDEHRSVIINRLKGISGKKWTGDFAELSAYDYLNFGKEGLLYSIDLDKEVQDTTTLAKQFKNRNGEPKLDCYFRDFDVYIDVKRLSDNVKELLEGIYKEVREKSGRSDFYITEERDSDLDFKIIENKRNELLNELVNEINSSRQPYIFRSKSVPQITFRFHWESGSYISIHFYNPYRHAKEHHKLTFKNAHQFVVNKPFLLLFVVFPWFNGIVKNFNNSNQIFYRSFSRRVFFQYKNDETQFRTLNPEFNSDDTIYSVSKKLSGIVFLEDHSITSTSYDKPYNQYSAFAYLNPNADNSVIGTVFHEYLRSLPRIECDDFEFDNY